MADEPGASERAPGARQLLCGMISSLQHGSAKKSNFQNAAMHLLASNWR